MEGAKNIPRGGAQIMEGGPTTSTKNGGSVDELGTFWGVRDDFALFWREYG